MYTLNNLIEANSDKVFSMTGFNYDITEAYNEDGSVNLIFDCESDMKKFKAIYSELS